MRVTIKSKCYHCGKKLMVTNGYAEEWFWYCNNNKCSAHLLQQLPREKYQNRIKKNEKI